MSKLFSQIALVVTGIICIAIVFSRKNNRAPGHTGSTMHTPVKITAADGKKMMSSGQPYRLIDVRTAEEFSTGHIPGALLIPDYEIEEKAPEQIPDKNDTIIVYCRSGRRSAGAAKMLTILGYNKVYDMGGIIDWPYETEK